MGKFKLTKEKLKKFWSGSGFYVVLAVCVLAVGTAAWGAYRAGMMPLSGKDEQDIISSYSSSPVSIDWGIEEAGNNVNDVEIVESSSKADETSSKDDAQQTNANTKTEKNTTNGAEKLSYAYPCGNTILKEYSDGQPVFSETMQDWRCHNGIDFTAKKGTNVKAIASGTVKEIKEDLMWGWTAVIEHEGGITAHYCGLQSNLSIKPNQKVDMGEVIGGVGDIPCEVAESEHFHFELYKDGKLINPLDVLGKTIETQALGNGAVD